MHSTLCIYTVIQLDSDRDSEWEKERETEIDSHTYRNIKQFVEYLKHKYQIGIGLDTGTGWGLVWIIDTNVLRGKQNKQTNRILCVFRAQKYNIWFSCSNMYKQRQRQKDLNKKFVGKYIANVAVLNIKETFVQFVVFQFFQTRCLVCFVV